MTDIVSISRDHLSSCGESYFKHMKFAGRVGAKMITGGLACMAHGLLPGLFETTGSRTIKSLAAYITDHGR